MIYTVTLNPAIDYVISVETFEKHKLNSYVFEEYGAGGKGVNVSRLLTSFGIENTALGFVRGFSGMEIVNKLEQENCLTDFIFLPQGHSRINIKIQEKNGCETDFNGLGTPLPPDAAGQLIGKLSNAGEGDIIILAGSLPKNADENIYAEIIKWANTRGIDCVIDAVNYALLSTLPHKPFLIKPNHEELGGLFGVKIDNAASAKKYAKKLQLIGARNVVVSLGSEGALFVSEKGKAYFYSAVSGNTVSTVGAGDSMVAGILYGLASTKSWDFAMKWGICAGAATAFTKGIASAAQVTEIYKREFEN